MMMQKIKYNRLMVVLQHLRRIVCCIMQLTSVIMIRVVFLQVRVG